MDFEGRLLERTEESHGFCGFAAKQLGVGLQLLWVSRTSRRGDKTGVEQREVSTFWDPPSLLLYRHYHF